MKEMELRLMGVRFVVKPELDRLMIGLPPDTATLRYLDKAEVRCLRDFLNNVLES